MSVNHPRELLRPDGSLPQLFLPSPPSCPSVDDVRKYTLSIMDILGLKQYDVRWSNARLEAGHCLQNSHVSLTRSHIDCGLKRKDYPAIWKVVLHEIAHALDQAEETETPAGGCVPCRGILSGCVHAQ